MQSSPNRSHPSNSPITGKILGISHGLTLLSDFRRVIREQIQRLAAKFPAQRNWEFLSRNWETTRRKEGSCGTGAGVFAKSWSSRIKGRPAPLKSAFHGLIGEQVKGLGAKFPDTSTGNFSRANEMTEER